MSDEVSKTKKSQGKALRVTNYIFVVLVPAIIAYLVFFTGKPSILEFLHSCTVANFNSNQFNTILVIENRDTPPSRVESSNPETTINSIDGDSTPQKTSPKRTKHSESTSYIAPTQGTTLSPEPTLAPTPAPVETSEPTTSPAWTSEPIISETPPPEAPTINGPEPQNQQTYIWNGRCVVVYEVNCKNLVDVRYSFFENDFTLSEDYLFEGFDGIKGTYGFPTAQTGDELDDYPISYGKLLDENGYEVVYSGNRPYNFFAPRVTGWFLVNIPSDIKSGYYECIVYPTNMSEKVDMGCEIEMIFTIS